MSIIALEAFLSWSAEETDVGVVGAFESEGSGDYDLSTGVRDKLLLVCVIQGVIDLIMRCMESDPVRVLRTNRSVSGVTDLTSSRTTLVESIRVFTMAVIYIVGTS